MKQRIVFLGWLRVITCLMVLTVHACECIYLDDYTFSFPSEGAKYAIFFYQSMVRPTAVPLFLIASAFLLIPVKTDPMQFFRKRFTRELIPLLVFQPLYAILPTLWGAQTWPEAAQELLYRPTFAVSASHGQFASCHLASMLWDNAKTDYTQ